MYQKTKQILKAIIPTDFIYRNELFFRSFYYQFYRGKKYKCNICHKTLSKFIQIKSGNLICPYCGSASRNRRLWSILQDFLKENYRVLHFSPARSLYRKLKNAPHIEYTSTDFVGEFFADKQLDITNIKEKSDIFDLIICYHVLEHIEDDQKAISELYRVLKAGGSCLIQTPFKEGDIFEDSAIITAHDRLQYFGQEDHMRIYSVKGLQERLLKAGFKVEIKEFKEDTDNFYGLKEIEFVIIAKKSGIL